jgi:hypothetical protein
MKIIIIETIYTLARDDYEKKITIDIHFIKHVNGMFR